MDTTMKNPTYKLIQSYTHLQSLHSSDRELLTTYLTPTKTIDHVNIHSRETTQVPRFTSLHIDCYYYH